ncbi:MAG TPA: M17 family peptidase N-terminal domain-containing protein, partial [Gemmatimonadales bacterium]|nr:M17 family peptidase N-terminal domain-containing protein [Gemmatimonadales bacterium]
MNYQLSAVPLAETAEVLVAVGVPKLKEKSLPKELASLDALSGGVLGQLFSSGDVTGARDEVTPVYLDGGRRRLLLVGMGKAEDISRAQLRRAAAVAARRARTLGTGKVAFAVPSAWRGKAEVRDFAQVAAEGMAQGAWVFDELKTPNEDRKPPVTSLTVIVAPEERAAAEAGFRIGVAVAEGQSLARRLQFLPPNRATPSFLAETDADLASRHGFAITVMDRARLQEEGFGALLAVAQGSATEPRFVVLEYKGAGDEAPVGLVGKGITFDTGGISIKPAASMEDMKYDMSGAAAVLGAMEAVGRLKPALNVVAA